MNWTTLLAAASVAALCALSAAPAAATPQLFSESKKEGMPAQNCQYCHVSKLPKKDNEPEGQINVRTENP